MNPQYLVKLEEEDEDQENGESGCTFLVGLIQKHRRRQRKMGEDMHTIGFGIYEVRAGQPRRQHQRRNPRWGAWPGAWSDLGVTCSRSEDSILPLVRVELSPRPLGGGAKRGLAQLSLLTPMLADWALVPTQTLTVHMAIQSAPAKNSPA